MSSERAPEGAGSSGVSAPEIAGATPMSDPVGPGEAAPEAAAPGEGTALHRGMTQRHLLMISLGGVVGTGLFLSSGYTISQAGPAGTILAYGVGAVLVYLVMMCLGELSTAMPWTGSFHVYATRFLGPGTGFTVAVLYWLTWTVALGSEFTASGLIMQRWLPQVPVWVFSAASILLIAGINLCSVRIFGRTESWLAGVKVVAIVAFILLGAAAMVGLLPLHDGSAAPFFSELTADGWFPHGLPIVFTTMLAVDFAYSGTELIGVTAGEAQNPRQAVPRAIRAALWRLVVFFLGAITVIAALIPYRDAGVVESPFVTVLQRIGVPYAADVMNLVILTAILSAANSGLYASTRMLWSLAQQGMVPRFLGVTTGRGVPVRATLVSLVGGLLTLLSSVLAPGSVYLVLVSISGLAVTLVWVAICACQLVFRCRYLAAGGRLEDLPYRTPGYPVVPVLALVLTAASCVLIVLDPEQRPALFWTVPFVAICYLTWFLVGRARRRAETGSGEAGEAAVG